MSRKRDKKKKKKKDLVDVTEMEAGNSLETALGDDLDANSQWISTVLDTPDVRALADEWDVRKHVWQRFWDRLFEEEEYNKPRYRHGIAPVNPVRPPKPNHLNPVMLNWDTRIKVDAAMDNAPPMLLDFDGSYWERHMENKLIGSAVSTETYLAALQQQDKEHMFYQQVSALQFVCIKQLAGLDLFWPGKIEDMPTRQDPHGLWYRKQKKNTSDSKWGTLKVYPFPFTAIFRYDDYKTKKEYVVFSTCPVVKGVRRFPEHGIAELDEFVRLNTDTKIADLRQLRIKLRSLDEQSITVKVKFPRPRHVKGTFYMVQSWDDVEDIWKNPRTMEVLSLAPGFGFRIETTSKGTSQGKCQGFVCGDPEDGVHPDNFVRQANEEIDEGPNQLSTEALGIKNEYFDGSDPVLRKFVNPSNLDPIFLDYVSKLYQSYRDHLLEDFVWKKRTLSYEFWFNVYNNDKIKKRDLRTCLFKHEDPDSLLVRDLANVDADTSHSHWLDDLYSRLTFFDGSLKACCWYLFWHAVALNNRARNHSLLELKLAKKLDPMEPGSPCGAEVMERPALKELLISLKVMTPDGKGPINKELLDCLYDKIQEVEHITIDNISAQWMKNVKATKHVIGLKKAQDGVEQLLAFQKEQNRELLEEVEVDEEDVAHRQQNGQMTWARACSKDGACSIM